MRILGDILVLKHKIPFLALKNSCHLIMQNACSSSLSYYQCLNSVSFAEDFKFDLSKSQCRFFTVSPVKIKVNIANIQWHRLNIPIPKGSRRTIKRNWTKGRLKLEEQILRPVPVSST